MVHHLVGLAVLGLALALLAVFFIAGKEDPARLPVMKRGRPIWERNERFARQPWFNLKPWVKYIWNALLIFAAALPALAYKLDTALKPSQWPWVHRTDVQVGLGVALSVVVFTEELRRLTTRFLIARRDKLKAKLEQHLSSAIATVSVATGVPVDELGAGVFVYHRSWRKGERFIRLARLRLLNDHGESGVVMRPGMGTVGACWETRNPEHHDWSGTNRRYQAGPPPVERWNRMQAATQHGFDHESWMTMRGRYAEVKTSIILAPGGRKIGVLAVDRRWHREMDANEAIPRLNTRKVEAGLEVIAKAIASDLGAKA